MRMVRVWFAAALCLAPGLALIPARGGDEAPPCADYADCAACHADIERIGPCHPEDCAACHLPPRLRGSVLPGHEDILPEPSALEHAEDACGPCHPGEVRAVRASTHATLAGLVNRTRAQWGAPHRSGNLLPGVDRAPRPAPPSVAVRRTAALADDFLRTFCLRCHLGERGPDEPGLRRSRGCAACHMRYAEHGGYDGGDAALAGASARRPERHEITLPRDGACLACHRENHAGADFHGRFQGGAPPIDGAAGTEHPLARDVHAERGMGCTDCHDDTQIMGMGGPAPSCRGCHGDATAPPSSGPRDTAGRRGWALRAPRPESGTPGHDPALHGRVRCEACHAQWFFGDYGFDVLCLDAPPGDPRTARILARGADGAPHHGLRVEADARTLGRRWITSRRIRRWEHAPLGLDRRGRIAVLRPRHQYAVTYVNHAGRVVLDAQTPPGAQGLAAFAPYAPHTTGPAGRMCTDCHGNAPAVGLGPETADHGPAADRGFDILRVGPTGSLPPVVQRRLLRPGKRWKMEFSRHIGKMLEER